jgi:hypothetical protein
LDSKLQRRAGLAAVINLAMIGLLSGPPTFSKASTPVRGITNPVLAMEVVRNVGEVDAILSDAPSPDREVMRLKQFADFGFIAAYATLFVLMSILLMPQGRSLAIAAAALGLIAAICDVIENVGILRIVDADLSHTTQGMIEAIRYPSLIKWGLAALSIGLLGVLLVRTGRSGLRIIGVLNLLAAALGLAGVFDNVLLAWSGVPMLGGFLGLAILYFRPRWRYPTRRA